MLPFRGARPITSTFEERYDAISNARTEARRNARTRTIVRDEPPSQRLQDIIADRIYVRTMKERRLTQGYAFEGGLLGTEWIGPFSEVGLRSESLGFIAKRIIAATARQIESGRDKGRIAAGSSKLLGLDDPYIRLNRSVVSGFRVDLDATFDSFDALYEAVDRCRLPILPHFAVGRRSKTGALQNPHLWYLLPDTAAVWNGGEASTKIVALLHRVIAGVTHALAPIGADPGGLANPFHGKNPLSPLFSTEAWNDQHFMTLADWSKTIDIDAKDRSEISAPAKRGEILHGSNSVARTLFGWAAQTLKDAHHAREPDYLAALDDRDALGRYLADTLRRDAVLHLEWNDEHSLQTQCRRIAHGWNVAKIAKQKNRGVLKKRLASDATLDDRQRAGQVHTSERRREKSLSTIVAAIRAARETGVPPSQSGIARATGLARSTVIRHWDKAVSESLSHSVLRKKGNGLVGLLGSRPSTIKRPRSVKSREIQASTPSSSASSPISPSFHSPSNQPASFTISALSGIPDASTSQSVQNQHKSEILQQTPFQNIPHFLSKHPAVEKTRTRRSRHASAWDHKPDPKTP